MIDVRGHVMEVARPGAPLLRRERSWKSPPPGHLLVEVEASGVCRTDLHVLDGELPQARYPIVPGHQVVGRVVAAADDVDMFRPADRVGIPWLGSTCGICERCRAGEENLCGAARFTGCNLDGGFATHCVVDARFAVRLPADVEAASLAPLLCAGLIGYRAFGMCGPGKRIGLYGFGAAAHLLAQVAVAQGRDVYAFTRAEDRSARKLAIELGATWAGASDAPSPVPLDAAIIFASDGALVPIALRAVRPGGTVVCAGIHMSDIPAFPYSLLWGERSIRSVANLTRKDASAYFDVAAKVGVKAHYRTFFLDEANDAIGCLRRGAIDGCAVLVPHRPSSKRDDEDQ